MQEPLVSIIMGVYNAEKTLDRCIDSILKQTYINWEFIICNDCSKDRTKEILELYKEIETRIIILNNDKNLRLAASLNKCLEFAKGKYVARMDADDESLPDRLEVQVNYLENHPMVDCVGCNRIIFDDNGERGIRTSEECPTKELLLTTTPFAHPTIMMKKTVYDQLHGYTVSDDTMRAEDLDLWIRFYATNHVGYNIQKCLLRYHESETDLKKRSFKAAVETSKVFIRGYKILKFPIYKYAYALKPIIASLIPNRIMDRYHQKKLKKR